MQLKTVVVIALVSLTVASAFPLDANSTELRSQNYDPSGTCGTQKAPIKKDCDHPDMGSCGNACCILDVTFDASAEQVYNTITTTLEQGGADNLYSFINGSDYTQFGLGYVLQGQHMTAGASHYIDTLDITFVDNKNGASTSRFFSMSTVEGALGDYGQNYKNLISLLDASKLQTTDIQMSWGCGSKSSSRS